MAKPGTQLEWCNNNPVDATSLQPAIIDPSGGKKDSGFLRLEKPPRQDINWFQNLAGLWSAYFEAETDLNNTHRASDGTDHADVVSNNTHRSSNGTDHADVVSNTSAISTLNNSWSSIAASTIAAPGATWTDTGSTLFHRLNGNDIFFDLDILGGIDIAISTITIDLSALLGSIDIRCSGVAALNTSPPDVCLLRTDPISDTLLVFNRATTFPTGGGNINIRISTVGRVF